MSIKRRIALMGIASAMSVVLSGCGNSGGVGSPSAGMAPEKIATTPQSIVPSRRDLVGYALLTGQLYWPPDSKANIPMPNRGTVDSVRTPVGSRVEMGQILLTLQDGNNQSASTSAQSTLSAAQSAYNAALLQYGDPVRQAKEELQGAQQAEREARANQDPTGIDSATQTRQTAESTLQQARSQQITNMLTYRQQLDQARAAASIARNNQLQSEVKAPISGTVMSLNAPTGVEIGGPNATIGQIVNLSAVQIRATYPSDYQRFVRDGSRVVITFADIPNKPYDGRVTRIRTMPNGQGVTENMATIWFSNVGGLVKPTSQIQRVGIREGSVRNALCVPVAAIQKDAQGKSCVRDEAGNLVEVKTGVSDGEYVEIKSGLSEDARVRMP